jgi:lysophospholipase L1-like esterase
MRRSVRLYLVYLGAMVVLCMSAAELLLRWRGVEPWRPPRISIQVEPGGRFFQRHPTLGYTHLPGSFRVTLPGPYTFRVTHGDDTLRITQPPAAPAARDAIWIFGGSFTHGWSVNDEDSYPWRLQQRMPDYEIVNFGVTGYGTVHSLIQFREALERRERPRIAVIAYGSLHDVRNTFLRKRRKSVLAMNRLGPLVQPVARIGRDGKLQIEVARVVYRELPGMRRSALVHFVEQRYNDVEDRIHHSRDVSKAIIGEFRELARAHGVELLLVGILPDGVNLLFDYEPNTSELLRWAEQRGIATADISVDLTRPEYLNLPHDFHPSALAHERHAEKLEAALRPRLAGR